jgi:phosphinothricin acetyltransferase
LYRAANSAILKFIREWKENAGNFRPAEDESMDKIIIRPMTPEDWGAVSRIYVEGIATEYATFQTECPPYTAWDASHTKECRLVILSGGVLAVRKSMLLH